MNIISTILFVIGVVILIFSLSLKTSNFPDVRKIFLEHFRACFKTVKVRVGVLDCFPMIIFQHTFSILFSRK